MIPYEEYLRLDKFPHIWCTGCGCGIVLKAMIRAIHRLGLKKDDVVMVSGIGCSSRTPGYVDFNTLHTTHGRAIAFATGVKLVKPQLHVIVITGDGDGTAIGGNHLIHAARRNINLTVVLYNNHIYGMTGGQSSPTTPRDGYGTTTPHGNIEQPFNICELAEACGASFVARSTAYHAVQLTKLIERAIEKRGFSLVEVLTPCPTYFGRKNRLGSTIEMLKWQKDNSISVSASRKSSPEELGEKVIVGVLVDREKPEYTEEYARLVERIKVKEET
jgi:2-oxoglutarate ferredoxin oxidoreductase subunit beta